MQIKFRYTDLEYHRLRKLNYLVGLPKWKTYGMVFLCLLPSLLLVLVTQSWIAILSASCLMFCLIAVGLVSAIREKKIVDQHDRVMTLTPFSTHVLTSHTQAESRWDYFDEFWETADEFWFKRLERHSMIPKRAVEESEFEEIRSYGNKANSSTTNETENDLELDQGEPVSVYQRFFSQGKGEIYQFRYNADDLTKFVSDPLKLIDTSERWAANQDEPTQPKGRQNFFGCFWLIVFVTLLVYTLLSTSSAELTGFSSGNISINTGLIAIAIVLPFILLRIVNRFIRARANKYKPQVPTHTNQMRLLKEGWAIGNPKSCQFFDWRDIESLYQNKFCFGFRTVADLIQVVPKRIFADQQATESFIENAIQLRREYLRTFEGEKATVIETGNPYQAPQE